MYTGVRDTFDILLNNCYVKEMKVSLQCAIVKLKFSTVIGPPHIDLQIIGTICMV